MNIRRTIPVLLAPLLVLTAAACGGDDDSDSDSDTTVEAGSTGATATSDAGTGTTGTTGTTGAGGGGSITVGSADFSESQLLGQIYGQALAAVGFEVSYQPAIGAREVYYSAIESGEIDLVPEYTNSLLSFVVKAADPDAPVEAANVEEQISALDEALPEGLEVLTPSTAEDKDVIVCTAEAAEEHDLATLSDLGATSTEITLGAPPEFETRSPFGLVGFQEVYGATQFEEFVPLAPGAVADALTAGQIDCGNLFSTVPIITTSGWVSLEDDKGTVPNEAVLPLVRSEVVTPELEAALDEVNAALDTDVLKELMVQVDGEAQAPEDVAKEWLDSL